MEHNDRTPAKSGRLLDESASLGVRDRLQAVVSAELAVDVMEVVAQGLGGNVELAGDGGGVAAFSE